MPFPYIPRDRPRIDVFDTSIDDSLARELQKRSVRNTLITQRCVNLRADSLIKQEENGK